MKVSERDKKVKELQLQVDELNAKIRDLKNQLVTPDPFDFSPLNSCFHSLSVELDRELRKQGVKMVGGNAMTVRHFCEYENIGIFLGSKYDLKWEVVVDSLGAQILIPATNKIKEGDDSKEDDDI